MSNKKTKMENRERNILKRVFLSELEVQILERRMKESRSPNFSTYARLQLLSPVIVNVDTKSFEQVILQLKRMGNNLNQISKVANQNKVVGTEELKESIRMINGLESYLKRHMKKTIEQVKEEANQELRKNRRYY